MGITIAALLSVGQVCLLQSACTAPSTRMPDVRLGLLGSCRNVMTNRICKRGRWDLVSYRAEVITDKIKPTCLYCCKNKKGRASLLYQFAAKYGKIPADVPRKQVLLREKSRELLIY